MLRNGGRLLSIYDINHRGEIGNDEIQRRRTELSCYSFDLVYSSGQENTAADTTSRVYWASTSRMFRKYLRESLSPNGSLLSKFHATKESPIQSAARKENSIYSCLLCQIKPKVLQNTDWGFESLVYFRKSECHI